VFKNIIINIKIHNKKFGLVIGRPYVGG